MADGSYDIIIIGGGLGGSTLAKAMAEHGARVLVLEREHQFKDRVRGEIMAPWGVAEIQALGLYELLINTCARETRWFAFYVGPEPSVPRDLLTTTPQRAPCFAFYHPEMQDVLLQVAADAGAEVRRGATRASGPLATFDGAETWVEHPYKAGVVLIGDAAAASDPTWGQGLSMTVRDARVLRDQLCAHDDWEAAGHAYAAEHDRYYGVIHTVDNWLTELFLALGPEAEACRDRALPLIDQDGTRVPDHIISGPELPAHETVRQRFFGEEEP
jgi:2-polyprenyl-6-methoxyphenol hydroxylase-like FAD-dependent oxidoreductase